MNSLRIARCGSDPSLGNACGRVLPPLTLGLSAFGLPGGQPEYDGPFRPRPPLPVARALLARPTWASAQPPKAAANFGFQAKGRQIMQALDYLQANAERLQIDPDRIALAGDSAGAHIAAQVGALVTTPGYADAVGLTPTITPEQLRGVVLACGPYDLRLAREASSAAGRRFIQTVLWAYSGKRHFLDDPAFAAWSVTDNVTPAFPAALITVGNADPLKPHSVLLAEKLRAQGVETETLFYLDDHQPPLGHEYQFDLDADAGQRFLEHLLTFLRMRLGAPPQP